MLKVPYNHYSRLLQGLFEGFWTMKTGIGQLLFVMDHYIMQFQIFDWLSSHGRYIC